MSLRTAFAFVFVCSLLSCGVVEDPESPTARPYDSSSSSSSSVISDSANSAPSNWPKSFRRVTLESSFDTTPIDAMVRRSNRSGQPLVFVFHTWRGTFEQLDASLADEALRHDWNYIHPDLRGPNVSTDACCSEAALSDLDDWMAHALAEFDIDRDNIHFVGASGGGYMTLCALTMRAYAIGSYSAWVPISDLAAWYESSKEAGTRYADDVLACTGSPPGGPLDHVETQKRSPISTPMREATELETRVHLYTGIRDGFEGSVPVSQSLRFYNQFVEAQTSLADSPDRISDDEISRLSKWDHAYSPTGAKLGDRDILFSRQAGTIRVVVFDGAHEILEDVAIAALQKSGN